jgi:hypothetical protein
MPATVNRTGRRRRDGDRWRWAARCAVVSSVAVAACGRLWPVQTAPSPASPHDTYACALSQARGLGYRVTSDTAFAKRRDIEAYKDLPSSARGPGVTEFTRKNVLVVRVADAPASSGSTMRVKAGTVSVQETRRGPTEVNEPATGAVAADADTLVAHCRKGAAPDSATRTGVAS